MLRRWRLVFVLLRIQIPMGGNRFKIKYAETMMYYQRIENDIKCIYAYMRAGDVTR